MASHSSILVDPGSTTKHLTWNRSDGTNTGEVDKHVLDEPFQPTYMIPVTGVALATANSHPLEIMAGASLRVIVQYIKIMQAVNSTSIQLIQWRLFRLSSAGTGGSAITPAPLDPSDSASGATAMTLASSKGTETTQVGEQRGMVHTTAATAAVFPVIWDFREFRHKGLVIAAGVSNGIAIKNVTADAACTVDMEVYVTELPYTI